MCLADYQAAPFLLRPCPKEGAQSEWPVGSSWHSMSCLPLCLSQSLLCFFLFVYPDHTFLLPSQASWPQARPPRYPWQAVPLPSHPLRALPTVYYVLEETLTKRLCRTVAASFQFHIHSSCLYRVPMWDQALWEYRDKQIGHDL